MYRPESDELRVHFRDESTLLVGKHAVISFLPSDMRRKLSDGLLVTKQDQIGTIHILRNLSNHQLNEFGFSLVLMIDFLDGMLGVIDLLKRGRFGDIVAFDGVSPLAKTAFARGLGFDVFDVSMATKVMTLYLMRKHSHSLSRESWGKQLRKVGQAMISRQKLIDSEPIFEEKLSKLRDLAVRRQERAARIAGGK